MFHSMLPSMDLSRRLNGLIEIHSVLIKCRSGGEQRGRGNTRAVGIRRQINRRIVSGVRRTG
jgi:hypothetical protein